MQFSSKCQLNLDVYELLNYLVSILFLADMRLSNDTDLSVYIPYLNKDKDRNKTFLFLIDLYRYCVFQIANLFSNSDVWYLIRLE